MRFPPIRRIIKSRYPILAILAFLLLPSSAFAAISFDTAQKVTATSGTITVGSLTNGVIMMRVGMNDATSPSNITVNGSTAVLLDDQPEVGTGHVLDYYVVLGNVSGSLSYSETGGSLGNIDFASYSKVNQLRPIESHLDVVCDTGAGNACGIAVQIKYGGVGVMGSLVPLSANDWAWGDSATGGACAKDGLDGITNRFDTASINAMQIGDSNGTFPVSVPYFMATRANSCGQVMLLQMAIMETDSPQSGFAIDNGTLKISNGRLLIQ